MSGPGCIGVRPFELSDLEAAADFAARARAEDEAVEPFAQRLAIIASGPRALLPLWRIAAGEDERIYGIAFAAQREARAAASPRPQSEAPRLAGVIAQPAQLPREARQGRSSIEVYGAVAPALRRQGLGRQLFEPILSWAREQPETSLRARVRDLPGQRFLEALGFEKGPAQLSLARHGAPPAPREAPGVQTRPLDRRDARGLLAFKALTRDAYADAPDSFESRADELEQLFGEVGRLLLLGLVEKKPAGYLSAIWLGRTLGIEEVAVLPEARRYGLGRALCTAALQSAQTALLTVSEQNLAARALYQSLGFQQVSCRVIYLWPAVKPSAAP